eukprot:gene21272-7353_t
MVSTAARRLEASSLPVGWSPSVASAIAFLLVADVTDVDLSWNSIAVNETGAFSGLPLLTTLDLSGNSIAAIDAGTFAGLPLLTTLDLSGNSIAVIDAGTFAGLPLLTTLDLSSNRIAAINAGTFAGVPLLTTLYLSSNRIAAIDAGTFAGVPLLTTLHLSGNPIATAAVGSLDSLLNVATFTADTIYNAGYGTYLAQTDGAVEACARTVAVISNSVFVALCNQGCDTSGSEVICRGVCDQVPGEDYCELQALTKVSTFVNKDVIDIDLSWNIIAVIDAGAFSDLPLLTTVDLIGNRIEVIDAGAFSDLPSLTTLGLSANSIAVIDAGAFADLPLLTTVDLSDNSIAVIDAGAFSDLPSLTTLDLSANSISVIDAGAFADLPLLTTLDLSANSISVIDAGAFADLPLLTTVDLSDNSIAVIDAGAFADLPLLTTVDLSDNTIAVIDAGAFSDLPSLTTLDLPLNALTIYDYSQMDGVKELCEAANAAQTLLSADPLCVPSYKSPGESAFIAVSAGASATVGLALLAVLWQVRRNAARASTEDDTVDEDAGTLTHWDVGHVLFITFRMFDLLTDYGVIGFTSKQPSWEEVMYNSWSIYAHVDPTKYISLTSAIIGTLLFVPDLFVFARKLGLAQEIGGVFNWYKPTQKAAMVIMVSTLLLE